MKVAIGIDLDWPYEHHYGIVKGILRYGQEQGWECFLEPWMETTEDLTGVKMGYDGIISRVTPSLETVCRQETIPLVNVWFNSPVKNVPFVGADCHSLGRKMADYFLKKGFQKILFLGQKEDKNCTLIFEGMKECTVKKDILPGSLLISPPVIKNEWDDFHENLLNWLKKYELPVAIACSSHLTARYLSEWCMKMKFLVPDDIAILCAQSNELICESFEPSLSHIENTFIDIGYGAAEVLSRLIKGENVESSRLYQPGELKERRSTDVEPVSDRTVARAMRYIWDNSVNPILVDDVATFMKMSRRSLERRFRKFMNRTVNEEILRTRLERALRLLGDTDKTAKIIAEESGFASDQRMSQVFRQKLGITPLDFRKSYKCRK